MDNSDHRFQGQLGDEYELFKLASPHYDELQNSVGELIRESFKDSSIFVINVLEIGFGAGATSVVILASNERVKLTAIDNEPLMEEKAGRVLAKFDKSRYQLLVEDALEYLTKCEERSFDVVASAWVIHNFKVGYRLKVLAQIYRVLKPGGIFINADKIETTDRKQHQTNMEWQLAQFEAFDKIGRHDLRVEWTKHYLEDSKPDRAQIEEDFKGAIIDTGFKSFQILKRWHDDAVALIRK